MAGKKSKLNQIIAVANGEKSRAKKIMTKIYQKLDKEVLFSGISKTYEPIDEEGEELPKEEKFIQIGVDDSIQEVKSSLKEMFNVVATQDVANCIAKAAIEVDGKVIASDVPVTHLLFLEKQLEDINTFVNLLPTLDPTEKWTYNEQTNCFVSEEKKTIRTKKTPEVIVKYDATDKHPAQTELIYIDKPAGYWHTIKFSGATTKKKKDELLEKIRKLQKAVKYAREEANNTEVEKSNIGDLILDYIFE
ncbi:MAG: hypothetical protein JXJ04_20645 [Spirochaetales bacterium]|nr:hypothetical protein [Spirochaetales bacterium]